MFYVSKTFSETTPESAEHGDYSDSGFVYESERFTLSELMSVISDDGFVNEGAEWLSTYWQISDYTTMTEESFDLHIDRDKSSARAIKLWDAFQ